MNKRVTSLYIIIKDNRCLAFGNLKEIIDYYITIDNSKKYLWYNRKFKKETQFKIGEYHFQKLI